MKKCEVNPGMQVSTTFWNALNTKTYVKPSRLWESHRGFVGDNNAVEVYVSKISTVVICELSRIRQVSVRETN